MFAFMHIPDCENSRIQFEIHNTRTEYEGLRGNPTVHEVPTLSMYFKLFALLVENGYSAWNPTLDSPIVMMIATLYR